MINLILGNCLEELKKIEKSSIHCVITDPPYGLEFLDDNWNIEKIKKQKSNGVIKNLPKGMKFDVQQSYKFGEFYLEFSKLIFEILKPGGFYLSFSSPRLYHRLAVSVEDAGFEIRDMISWCYTQSQAKAFSLNHFLNKKKISEEEKDVIKSKIEGWKTPQLKPAFEPICVGMKPIEDKFLENFINHDTGLINTNVKQGINNDKFITNLITTDNINEEWDKTFLISKPDKKEKTDINNHPSVKPLVLMEQLIKIFSKEDSLILDPFMGSGTTLLACQNLNRNAIGIEINQEYYNITKTRLGF